MEADGGRKRKIAMIATVVLLLVGIVLLGATGIPGLLVLALATAIGVFIALRA